MADHIYVVAPDGDIFDGAYKTNAVIIADSFEGRIDYKAGPAANWTRD